MHVIPAIDLIAGRCARLRQGDFARASTYSTDPAEQAARLEQAGFKRLHVVDLDGARAGSGVNRQAIGQIVEAVSIPVQAGGGIRTEHDVAQLIDLGAKHLILGTVALEQPRRAEAWIARWRADRFIISLDLKAGRPQVRGWTQQSPLTLEETLQLAAKWKISQIICTDVHRDGTLEGPDIGVFKRVFGALPEGLSLIVAGGVSQPSHIADLNRIGVAGVVVGKAIYEGSFSPREFALAG